MFSAARLKRSYSCSRRTSSARGSSSSPRFVDGARQQHARLDLGQRRGHHQVLAGELELHFLHQLDVLHVLARDLGDRDVEDVEVLPADQVQQQVERTFERLEEHLERLRRDVEILRHLGDGLAIDDGERHFHLLGATPCPRGVGLVRRLSTTSVQIGFRSFHAIGLLNPPADSWRGALRRAWRAPPRAPFGPFARRCCARAPDSPRIPARACACR